MIKITIYQNQSEDYTGFRMTGHAEYAQYGRDIVCAAVSALVINTINSIERFTEDKFLDSVQEQADVVEFQIVEDKPSAQAGLLLRSLILGLQGIQREYGKKYIQIKYQRKQEV